MSSNKGTAMGGGGEEREHRSPRMSERVSASGSTSQSCIFCRIAKKELPSEFVHEDEQCVAFRDVNPQAPVHWLIVPKRHVERLHDLTEADRPLLGHLVLTARLMAERAGVAESGYRLVVNNGDDGGQTVPHLHLHLLGGRAMRWPPG